MSTRWRLTLIIILTAISVLAAEHFRTQGLFRLEMRVTTQNKGELQVAYDLGKGFKENPTNVTRLKPGDKPRKYKIDLPTGDLKALRVIAWTGKGEGTFNNFRLYGPAGGVAKISNESFSPANGGTSERSIEGVKITTAEGFAGPVLEIHLPTAIPLHLTFLHWARLVLPISFAVLIASFLLLIRKGHRAEMKRDGGRFYRAVKGGTFRAVKKSGSWLVMAAAQVENFVRQSSSKRGGVVFWLTVLLIPVLLFARKPDAFLNPQFWAEDGKIFFLGAVTHGYESIFMSYAGYLHLVPRLIAWLASGLDPLWIPTFYNLAAVLVMALVGVRLFSVRLLLPCKPLVVMALVMIPHTGEVFVNATNVQWFTALLLVGLLFLKEGSRPWQQAGDLLILCVAGLTGPFIVILLPFFALNWLLKRTRERFFLMAMAGALALVQVFFILDRELSPEMGAFQFSNYLAILCRRVFLPLLAPNALLNLMSPLATQVAGGLLVVLFGWLALRSSPYRTIKWMLWGCSVILLAAGSLRGRMDLLVFDDFFNGDRYFYMTKVMTIWFLTLVACETSWHRWLARGVITLAFLSSMIDFQSPPFQDYQWSLYADKIRAGEQVEIPINPNWIIHYPGRQTSLVD